MSLKVSLKFLQLKILPCEIFAPWTGNFAPWIASCEISILWTEDSHLVSHFALNFALCENFAPCFARCEKWLEVCEMALVCQEGISHGAKIFAPCTVVCENGIWGIRTLNRGFRTLLSISHLVLRCAKLPPFRLRNSHLEMHRAKFSHLEMQRSVPLVLLPCLAFEEFSTFS